MGSILKEWQEKWASEKGEWPNVIPINLNVGIQIYDRAANEVLMYLHDEDSPGPHRSTDVLIQAEKLIEFYNKHPRPFQRNELALWQKTTGVIRIRILECKADSHCPSGWRVTATWWRAGRRPKWPEILLKNVDSRVIEKYGD